MASTIKIKNSSTAGAIPTSSDLVQGELAVNVTDKTIFTENSSGTIVELGKNYTGFKNRIINGCMMIDQRNAGASVTPASGDYTLDRYRVYMTQASKFTVQQNAGAVTPPVGFGFYLGCTSSSAYSVGASDYFTLRQRIEGFNFADMAWGTANAAAVTLSFWVRSSLTGTFGGVLTNSAANRTYPFSYTISAANTWEQKTVTIAGDTTGTWIGATNGVGAQLIFSLGAGSTYLATANAWTASEEYGVTGQVNVVATNAATWYVTGVQLEKGSTATSFDYRPYGTELALCQRYYSSITLTAASGFSAFIDSTTAAIGYFAYPVTMRSTPVMSTSGTAGDYGIRRSGGALSTCSVIPVIDASSSANSARVNFTVASGLTAGQGCGFVCASTSTFLGFNSEL